MATIAMCGIALFLIYTITSLISFGIPESLSQTYYLWSDKNSKLDWLFRAALIGTSLLLMAPMIYLGEDSLWQFTGFLTPAGLMFVGASPNYLDRKLAEKYIHPIAAWISAASSILWEIFIAERADFLIGCAILFIVLALITKTLKKSITFWLEMSCFISIFICIIKIFYF